jgi:UDP-N-acetylmuramoylalanine--D-glutamate ligase
MELEELKNKKILVVGSGIEGNAVFRYLKKHLPDSVIDVVDQKDGSTYLNKQKEYDLAIKSPGVKSELINIPYTTATNIFLANAKGKVIGITGTKGKSTTTTLIFEMLKKQGLDVYLGGNIGQSPLDFMDTLSDQSWTVLEMSSYQLQDAKNSPHIAVLLMIVPEHLDYHLTFEDYASAKRNILRFQTPEDFAVINRDYPVSNESDILTPGKIFHVSREREAAEEGSFVRDGKVWLRIAGGEVDVINTKDILLSGKHNLENVCAAVIAATLADVSILNIQHVLKTFKGLEHRLEFVREVGSIRFFNDSLATIPQATIEALDALEEVETLIAGGFDRGLDYKDLGTKIADCGVRNLILFPITGEKIWQAVCDATKNLPERFDVTTMQQAVRIAFAETTPGKICLMSPASASFNLFKNYKERGEQFKKEVGLLQA